VSESYLKQTDTIPKPGIASVKFYRCYPFLGIVSVKIKRELIKKLKKVGK